MRKPSCVAGLAATSFFFWSSVSAIAGQAMSMARPSERIARRGFIRSPRWRVLVPLVQAPQVRGALAGNIAHAALHDEGEASVVLHHAHVVYRIAIDQQEVGEVAGLDQAELVAALHDLAASAGRCLQRLAGREAEMADEM